jgi:hypothetical protein
MRRCLSRRLSAGAALPREGFVLGGPLSVREDLAQGGVRFVKDSGRNPERGSGEPGQGCPGTGEIERSRCGCPKDDTQRPMDLPALSLRDHPGGRIVCQEPVSGELSAEGERFGLALVEKPGAQPCQGLLGKRALQRDDLNPGRLLGRPSRIMGEDLRLDRRRNVDSAGTTEKREERSIWLRLGRADEDRIGQPTADAAAGTEIASPDDSRHPARALRRLAGPRARAGLFPGGEGEAPDRRAGGRRGGRPRVRGVSGLVDAGGREPVGVLLVPVPSAAQGATCSTPRDPLPLPAQTAPR